MSRIKIILIIGLVLRLIFACILHSPENHLYSDMKSYSTYSDMILSGEFTPFFFFQPIGFKFVLAFLKILFTQWGPVLGFIQAVLSTWTIYFIYRATKETWDEKLALGSALIATFHFSWIIFTGFALAETLFTFLLAVLVYFSVKIWKEKMNFKLGLLWGLIFFLSFTMKGTGVFMVPLLFLLVFKIKGTEGFKKFILPAGSVIALGLLLHGIYSFEKIGKIQLSASAGGLNFVEGKCPIKWNHDNTGRNWLAPMYYQFGYTKDKKYWDEPFTNSSFFMKQGWKCILTYPGSLITSLEGIPLLFTGNILWPANQLKDKEWARLFETFLAWFLLVGLIIYLAYFKFELEKELQLFAWLIPVLSLFMCVYVFKSEIRFRIPFDVFLIPICLKGWMHLPFRKASLP